MVIDSVSIEASSSVRRLPRSRTPWTASLQSPGKTSDQNKPLAAELKKRSTPLLLFAVPKRKQSECCHRW